MQDDWMASLPSRPHLTLTPPMLWQTAPLLPDVMVADVTKDNAKFLQLLTLLQVGLNEASKVLLVVPATTSMLHFSLCSSSGL